VAGMKITLSSAMRARDVSRPQPHHEAEAQAADAGEPRPAAAAGSQRGSAPGTAAAAGPAPADDSVPGPGVKQEGGRPATEVRGGGSRRHRSRRRGR
jgi:hypothetical protein